MLELKMVRHALLTLVPLVAVAALAPLWYSNQLLLLNFIVFLILAQGINITYGFTGYLPFGFVGFFGAGAYGFAVAIMHLQAGPFVAMAVGGLLTELVALLLTLLLRLSGAYFAIANLAASLALYEIVSNPALTDLTRGPYGVGLSGVFNPALSYGVAVVLLALTLASVIFLRNSTFGLALQAIKDDAFSAAMAGIHVTRVRTIAWLLAALSAGLIGSDYAWYISSFYPDTVFSADYSVFAIVFALFGGVATTTGPILGVLVLYGLYNYIGITAPQYFQLVYGIVIVVTVLFLPTGLVSLLQRRNIDVP